MSGVFFSILIGCVLATFAARIWAATDTGIGTLNLQNSQYVSAGQTYFRDGAGSNNASIGVDVDLEKRWRALHTRALFKDEYSGTEKWNYLNIYELKASYAFGRGSTVIAGRHLDTWSTWEQDWRQGVFQSRYMQNKLRPESVGLTGVYLVQKDKSQSFTLGFLPVFIPDLGAHFYVRDNQFYSANPWFNPPASKFVFRQKTNDIHYSVDKPDLWNIAGNPGVVAKYERAMGRYFGRVSGAYKPLPQLLLGFPSEGRMIVGQKEDYMKIDITPEVVYHRVIGIDNSLRAGAWTVSGGVTYEEPDNNTMPASWTSQQVKSTWITWLGVSRPLEEDGPGAVRVHFGFLNVEGGDARDKGEFAGDVSLFEARYQYLEAYRLGLSKPWRGIFRFPLDTEASVTYDRKQNGGAFTLSSGLNFSREMRLSVEMDFLGLLGTDAEEEGRFYSLYRANDRVGVRMSYVF